MDPSRYLNKSVLRALRILELFNKPNHSLTIPEISKRVGLHRSTAHRLVLTLESEGWLRKIPDSESYSIGLKILTITSHDGMSLSSRIVVRPLLEELAQKSGETVVLSMADKIGVVCIDKIDSLQRLKISSEVGQYHPLHAGATGFAVLLGMSEKSVRAFLFKEPLPAFTNQTETDPEKLLDRYRALKKGGVVVSHGAVDPGVTAIAAPVFFSAENAYGSVGITMPTERASDAVVQNLINAVLETAAVIRRKIELPK